MAKTDLAVLSNRAGNTECLKTDADCGGFSVLRLSSMMGMMNISFTKEELLKMNKQLNRIKKPKKKS